MKKQVRIIGKMDLSLSTYNARQEILGRNGGKKLRMNEEEGGGMKRSIEMCVHH